MPILESDLYAGPRRDDSPAQTAARTLIDWTNTARLSADQTRALAAASTTDEKRIASVELPSDPTISSSTPVTVELTIDELTGSTETARLILEPSSESRLVVDLPTTSRLTALAHQLMTEGA